MATIEDFKLRFDVQGDDKVKKVNQDINNLKDDIDDLGKVGGPLGNTINGIVGKFGLLGTAAVAAGGAFVALGFSAIRMATELQNISNASGVAAGQLQNFKTSVISAGGSAEQYKDIITDLNKNVQDAASGNEQLQNSFRSLGVFVTDANGKVRNTGDILQDIVGLFRSGQISSEQYTASLRLLGESAKNLDLTKLNALRDPVADADIARLKEYDAAIDRVRARLERGIITFFGSVAEQADSALNKIKEVSDELTKRERDLNRQGKTVGTRLETEATFGLRSLFPREMSAEEKRRFEESGISPSGIKTDAGREERMAQLMQPYKSRAGVREEGGFGATSENVLKDRAARELRIFKSSQEEKKNILLQFAQDEEESIRIRADSELALSRKTITDKEELAAKIKEIESNRDLDIYNFRKNLQERQAAEEQRRADQLARETQRMNDIVERSRAVVEEQQRLNDLQKERNKFLNENLTATDRERQNAEELFNLERERLAQLQKISQIKDLPPAERNLREQELNELFKQRIEQTKQQQQVQGDLTKNFEAGWVKAYRQYAEDSRNAFETAGRIFNTVAQGMEDSFIDFAKTGKFEWKGFLNTMLEELLRSQVRQLMADMFGSKKSGSFFGSLGNLLGFANGGVIPTNGPVMVGERGPEILSGVAGRVVTPNNQIGGGSVTYNINAVDALSFKQMVAADPTFLFAITEQGRRKLPGAR